MIRDPCKSLRITWMDDSNVEVLFYGKSPEKSQVTIDHRKLPDTAGVTRLKSYWKERLDALK